MMTFDDYEERERKWLRRIAKLHPHLTLIDLSPIGSWLPWDGHVTSGQTDLTVELKIRKNISNYTNDEGLTLPTGKVMLEEAKRQELLKEPNPYFFACCELTLRVYVFDLIKAKPISFFDKETVRDYARPELGTTITHNCYLSKADCEVYDLKALSSKWTSQ